MRRITLLAAVLATTQCACIVAGGYSSRGGWFFWPGSLGLIVILALVFFVFGRRGR